MPEFLFPNGLVWVLVEPGEIGIAELRDGSLGLLVFSDDDLALTYAEHVGWRKTPTAFEGCNVLELLQDMQRLGVAHVCVDHTPGKMPSLSTPIEKAIADVQERTQ